LLDIEYDCDSFVGIASLRTRVGCFRDCGSLFQPLTDGCETFFNGDICGFPS